MDIEDVVYDFSVRLVELVRYFKEDGGGGSLYVTSCSTAASGLESRHARAAMKRRRIMCGRRIISWRWRLNPAISQSARASPSGRNAENFWQRSPARKQASGNQQVPDLTQHINQADKRMGKGSPFPVRL